MAYMFYPITSKYQSIHPFSASYPRKGRGGKVSKVVPLPNNVVQRLQDDPGIHSLSSVFWIYSEVPGKLPKEGVQIRSLNQQGAAALHLDV